MKEALVFGGNSGIGLSFVFSLIKKGYEKVHIFGKGSMNLSSLSSNQIAEIKDKTDFTEFDVNYDDFNSLTKFSNIQALIITIGIGRLNYFETFDFKETENTINTNLTSIIKSVSIFYDKIKSNTDFYCCIISSICGKLASPLYSVYAASKAGVSAFIKSINAELSFLDINNRILDFCPGQIKGTPFSTSEQKISNVIPLTDNAVERMINRELLFIPNFDDIYKDVLEKEKNDYITFGKESAKYKLTTRNVEDKKEVIGYLSGTFDLFHVGHLNLLRKAKQQCDYLIVGVHKSGDWKNKPTFISFEDRKKIVESIKYVDKVIESMSEDSEVWNVYKYNKLFVGSDYLGSDRFKKYEEFFSDKKVEIVYFPYTKGISSTELRKRIINDKR